jgi:hypothetical protein
MPLFSYQTISESQGQQRWENMHEWKRNKAVAAAAASRVLKES